MQPRELGSSPEGCPKIHATWDCVRPAGHDGLCAPRELAEGTDRELAAAQSLREIGS